MQKLLLAMVLLASMLLSYSNANAAATSGINKPGSYIFVQTARGGVLTENPAQAGTYLLKLLDVSKQVEFFSDRPQRITGILATNEFLQEWQQGAQSFQATPPNAAISGVKMHLMVKAKPVSLRVELSNPVYNPQQQTFTYTVRALDGEAALPKNLRFDDVALFIDGYCVSCSGHGF